MTTLGLSHTDEAVAALLRRAPSEWATAREVSKRMMLSLESASRALSRLMQAGWVETSNARPRGYRWWPFVVDVPWGFAIDRASGRLISSYVVGETPITVFIEEIDGALAATDEGSTILRLEGVTLDYGLRMRLEDFVTAQGAWLSGDRIMVSPVSKEAVALVARLAFEALSLPAS